MMNWLDNGASDEVETVVESASGLKTLAFDTKALLKPAFFGNADTDRILENSELVRVSNYVPWIGELTAPAAAVTPTKSTAGVGFVGAGMRLFDRDGAALQVLAVQSGDGLGGLYLVRHLDEAETAAFTCELVLDDVAALDFAEGFEGFT